MTAARSYATEKKIPKESIEAGVKGALWKEDKHAVALCFKNGTRTLCLVIIETADNEHKVVDVTRVEGMNLAKMGWNEKYTKVVTFPEKWRGADDNWWSTENALCQIRFTTRAWKGKQRYTTSEPLVIRKDLTPWWR